MSSLSAGAIARASRGDMPLRLLGIWHLVCAVAGGTSVLPVLSAAVRHPVGVVTLGLVGMTAAVGVALLVGHRGALGLAAVLQAAQVLALSLPGLAVWIVRIGLRVWLSIPPLDGRSVVGATTDAAVLTIWGDAARLPLGVSVNLCALIAFALCLSCLPTDAGPPEGPSA